MKLKRGSTSVRRLVFIGDSSSTTGAGLANLTHSSAGLVCWYFAGDLSNDVQITLVAGTLGTYTSGGFVAVDNANMPGWYEIGIPNAALDGGNEVSIQLRGATNMVPVNIYIELDSVDYQDATAFGLSQLDAAVSSRSTLTAANVRTELSTELGRIDAAVSSRSTLDGAGVRTAIGMASANLDTQISGIAASVWSAGSRTLTSFGTLASDVWAVATRTLTAASDSSGVTTLLSRIVGTIASGSHQPQSGDAFARLGAPAGASIAADIATRASQTSVDGKPTLSQIEASTVIAQQSTLLTVAGYLDTEIAAIKAKTDNLPSDPASQSVVASEITSATAGLATASALSTLSGYVDTEVAAIKAVTDKLDTTMVLDGSVYQFTVNSLENAPSGSGGGATLAQIEGSTVLAKQATLQAIIGLL